MPEPAPVMMAILLARRWVMRVPRRKPGSSTDSESGPRLSPVSSRSQSHSDRAAAIHHHRLPGHTVGGSGGQEHGGAGDFVDFADALPGRVAADGHEGVGIFHAGPGEIGADYAGGD